MQDNKRFKVFICNIIISVISVFSIAAYFIWPFFKVEVTLAVTPDMVESVFQSASDSDPSTPTEPTAETSSDSSTNIFENIDTEQLCANLDPISVAIELKTTNVLASLDSNGDTKENIQKIIDDNVNMIVDDIEGPLNKLVQTTVKEVSKATVKDSVKSSIKESLDDSVANKDEKANELLQQAGLTDEYIDNKIDTLFEDLSQGPIPVEDATDKIVDTIDTVISDVCRNAQSNDIEELKDMHPLTDEEKEDLKANLNEFVSTLADENGNVNMDSLVTDLMLMLIQSAQEDDENNENGDTSLTVSALSAAPSSDSSTPNSGNSKDELKTELTNMLNDLIPEDAADMITIGLQGISGLILFSFFTWIYLILKILAKSRRHCNAIKLKLPLLLGSLPYFLLALLPNVGFTLLKNPEVLTALELTDPATLTMLNSFNIHFFSGGFFSYFAGWFLFFFVLFYYGRLRRKLKKEAKKMKKEAKRMKKAGYVAPATNYGDNETTDYSNDESYEEDYDVIDNTDEE